jgi:hypothetical protein
VLDVLLHILANFDHEHSIVSLGGETSVSNRKIITEFIASEISLSTTSLSADRSHSF